MKRIWIYLAFAFTLTWGLCAWLFFSGNYLNAASYTITLAICMFMPTLAVVLTKLVTRERFFRGLGLRPRFRGNLRYYLLASWGITLLIVAGAAIYFLIFPAHYSVLNLIGTSIPMLLLTVLIFPIVNLLPAAGEEIGWRGYLLPKLLQRCSLKKTLLLSGLIWGLWHAPMIAMGHNYGLGYWGWPWLGILAMIVFCMVLGTIFSYVTLKSGSVWPAALGHAFLNGNAALGVVFLAGGATVSNFIGPMPVGIIGGSCLLVLAVVIFFTLKKPQSFDGMLLNLAPARQPQLEAAELAAAPTAEAGEAAAPAPQA